MLVWACTALIGPLHRLDATVLKWFIEREHPRIDKTATSLTRLLDPGLYILWGILLLAITGVRRRPQTALAVVAIMSLAPLSTEALKPLLAHTHAVAEPGVHISADSFPSGHSTAALALALCAVIVSPTRMRAAVAAVGFIFALAIGCSQVLLHRHMPSDVLGGYLVATFWSALAIAALRARHCRRPGRT